MVSLHHANDDALNIAVNVIEAARILGCDQSTVRELIRKGLLPAFRVGKSAHPKAIRIKLWALREWEDAHTVAGANQNTPLTQVRRVSRRARNRADDEADAWLKSRGA